MQTPMAYHYRFSHPAVAADCVVFGFDMAPAERKFTRNEPTRIMFRFLAKSFVEPFVVYNIYGFTMLSDRAAGNHVVHFIQRTITAGQANEAIA